MAIRYAVEGDLRFISHHDSLRLFERALARAGLPVRYSEGFNPRPRMTIALPRPVGVASRDELLVFELTDEVPPDEAIRRLQEKMPEGLSLLDAAVLAPAQRRVPCEASYEVDLAADADERLDQRVSELLSTSNITIARARHGAGPGQPAKQIDVRAYLLSVELDGTMLRWTQSISQDGTVRMSEVLEALGLPAAALLHRICRTRVDYRS